MANDQRFASLLDRLESVTNRLETIPVGKGGQTAADEGNTEIVEFFDKSVQDSFNNYYNLSSQIGDDVAKHAELVKKAVEADRVMVVLASKYKRPASDKLATLLKPLSDAISAVQDFREKNRGSKQFNNLSAVSEFIPCLGWVTVNPKPALYIKQMHESAQFYTNKILKEFKGKDEVQINWARSLGQIINRMTSYVTDWHATGLTWNPEGKEAPASAGTAPPPPPPAGPVPPPPPAAASLTAPKPADKRSALLSELNKGGDVTKGLKKVTNDMKTHKNPALRASGVVSSSSAPVKPATAPKPGSAKPAVAKPPVCRLDGKKWVVEYHNGNQNLIISETSMKQSVYIYKCDNSVIQVKGKVNSIAMDSCKKSALIFDNVISLVDFVNCQSVKGQANGAVPTISIGKTDGIQVYFTNSEEAIKTTIITSKSSEMNIITPGEDGDSIESAVPEQFTTIWDEKKKCFVTIASEIIA